MSIQLKELSKRFGNLVVVNRLSLEIKIGELFVLLGASGSGKSTVLRMIAGLSRADSGKIELNGKDVTLLPAQQRDTGFVFQNYSLFRHMSVAENIEFGLKIRKVNSSERRHRRDELLDLVGLGGLGNRYAHQLSGGQQQRVALARALAYNPSVLLLDEPFGALDVKIRTQLRKNLKEIQERLKLTTILVTHDQEEAFELGDRIGVIDRGNLIEVGAPEDLYHRPRTDFVANFIGGKNVLIGRVEEGGIRLGAGLLPVGETAAVPRQRVRILFRPETVLLQREPFAGNDVHLLGQGTVVESTFAGSFQKIRLEVERPLGVRDFVSTFGEKTIEIEAIKPSSTSPSDRFDPGQIFWVGFSRYHVLETHWPKLLLCDDDADISRSATEFGLQIAQKARSQVTVLSVAGSSSENQKIHERLEIVRQKWLEKVPSLEVRVRNGSHREEILAESQEGSYEMIVVGRKEKPRFSATLGTTVRQILARCNVPVAIVQQPPEGISNILICSAVGEPGKADVRVGGRIARLTGASATVLHAGESQSEIDKKRTETHLEQALVTLDTFGVKADSKIITGPAIESILGEAESGVYDLIIIGAPGPDSAERLYWHDTTTEIVNGTKIPILIVPMTE
jgi:ABC-type Fe3+/spermidine/putrescine transport system ATPase subunit/nucleotide-binding universal stress UspA family protein